MSYSFGFVIVVFFRAICNVRKDGKLDFRLHSVSLGFP